MEDMKVTLRTWEYLAITDALSRNIKVLKTMISPVEEAATTRAGMLADSNEQILQTLIAARTAFNRS